MYFLITYCISQNTIILSNATFNKFLILYVNSKRVGHLPKYTVG